MIGHSVRPGTENGAVRPGPGNGPGGRIGAVLPRPEDATVPISAGPVGVAGPGGSSTATVDAVRRDPEFQQLRGRLRRFVFTVTPLFLTWYGMFVVLSAFAPSLMRIPVIGSVNVGMLLGLAQFASTLAIVALYGRFARREIDPRVRELRAGYEGVVARPVRPAQQARHIWSDR